MRSLFQSIEKDYRYKYNFEFFISLLIIAFYFFIYFFLGKYYEDYWVTSKKILGDMKFLDNLINFDKDNIPPAIMKKVEERFVYDKDFDPAKIKNASTAAEGLTKLLRFYKKLKLIKLNNIYLHY